MIEQKSYEMIDYLHEKAEDIVHDASMSKEERQYRERLRLTIGKLEARKQRTRYVLVC
jgi:hypothetical protein